MLVLIVAGLLGWRWRHAADVAPAPAGGVALQPAEARLLAAAAREPANPQPFMDLGEEYAAAAQPASALWAYEEAASRAPGDGRIRLKLAAVLIRLGYPGLAETALRTVHPLRPGAPSPRTSGGSRGPAPRCAPPPWPRTALRSPRPAGGGGGGRVPTPVGDWPRQRTAPGAGPRAVAQARLDLADLLLATGRPALALAALKEAGAEAELLRGRAHEAIGNVAAAAVSYGRAGAAGDADAYERLARLELTAGRLKQAQEAMRLLGAARATRPEDLLLVAAIHAAAGTPEELETAAARLRRCIQLRPRNPEAAYQAGLLLLRKRNRGAAAVHLARAVQLDPGHIEARGRLADVLEALGKSARAHRERAAYDEAKDQPDRALAELRRATAAGLPDDREQAVMRVRLAIDLHQPAVAVKEAQAGLRHYPGDPQLMLQLGLLYQPDEWRAPMEQLCRDWMTREPASGTPYWLLGRQALGGMRLDDAIRLLTTACTKEPNRADFRTALGLAYLAVPTPENYVRARPWLEKAVALAPHSAEPHFQFGRVLEQAGELEAARRQYLQSLDAEGDQPAVLDHLIQVLTRLKRSDAARLFPEMARIEATRSRERSRLVHLVLDHPASPAPRIALARLLIRNGELAAARDQLERAAEAGPAAAAAVPALAQVNRLLRVQTS